MKACVFQIGETQQTKCFRAVSFPVVDHGWARQ